MAAAPSPIRDILEAIGLAIARSIVDNLDKTGRTPLRTNSTLKRQLLSGEAVKVTQGRSASTGRFSGYDASASLTLYALDYLQWVESGRKPFAKKVPLSAIIQFIKNRGIGQGRAKNGRFSKRSIGVNALAWAIQAAIYRRGIRARNVIAPAMEIGQHLVEVYLDSHFLDSISYSLDQQFSLAYLPSK